MVSIPLLKYLSHNLFEPLQSAFHVNHSTETALTKAVNDLLLALDSESASVLLLLNVSATFDTVDYGILLDWLENYFGISGQVLNWLTSYLSGSSQ